MTLRPENEISKICRDGVMNDAQIGCIAEALANCIDETFAARFVNKKLDESDVQVSLTLPSRFIREKFLLVNKLWRAETWVSHHRLSGIAVCTRVKPSAPQSKSTESVPAAETVDHAPKSEGQEVPNRIKEELIEKLDAANAQLAKVNDELKDAIERKCKAESDVAMMAHECAEISQELDGVKRSLSVKDAALEKAKKKLIEVVKSEKELKIEKEKNEQFIKTLKEAFPEDVVQVAALFAHVLPPTVGTRRIIYLYLGIITADPIEESQFITRFKLFDEELYLLLKDDKARLKLARSAFADDLNKRLSGRRVVWDFEGEDYNSEEHNSSDSFGTSVTEVVSAKVLKSNGKVELRARVRTDNSIVN